MSPSPDLAALALDVDLLLMRPANLATFRYLVEAYWDGCEQGTVEPIPFLVDDVVPTPAQRAVALAALRDAYCPGVEKIIPRAAELPTLGEATSAELPALLRAWKRAANWEAILDRVQNLGDYAVPWFTLQLRLLEKDLQTQSNDRQQERTEQSDEDAGSGKGQLKPSREKAYRLFCWAMEQEPTLKTDLDVYNWLHERSDLPDELPCFATWSKYLREARAYHQDHKHTPRRAKKATGKSVVRNDQI
jgi:hypothetical protein